MSRSASLAACWLTTLPAALAWNANRPFRSRRWSCVQPQILRNAASLPATSARTMPYAWPSLTVSPPWSSRTTRPPGCAYFARNLAAACCWGPAAVAAPPQPAAAAASPEQTTTVMTRAAAFVQDMLCDSPGCAQTNPVSRLTCGGRVRIKDHEYSDRYQPAARPDG